MIVGLPLYNIEECISYVAQYIEKQDFSTETSTTKQYCSIY